MVVRLVVLLALGLVAGTLAQVTVPDELYASLDPIDAIEYSESSRDIDAAESRAIAAMEQEDRDQQLMNPPTEEEEPAETTESYDDSRHEQQMDDLFGDMLHQQNQLGRHQRADAVSQERFEAKARDGEADSRLSGDSRNELGESESTSDPQSDGPELGEGAQVSTEDSSETAPAGLDQKSDAPGTKELQTYGTGRVTNEVQIGSNDGKLAAVSHGFSTGDGAHGRIMLFGKQSGLYLERNAGTWSIFSDNDKESGGVCLMTAYNNERAGLKICHTSKTDGPWASGNVGITGDLIIQSKQSLMDVERLHLTATGVSETGFVLRVGSAAGGPSISAGASSKSAWIQASSPGFLVINAKEGNVGIATTTPLDKLHVNGDALFQKVYLGNEKSTFAENRLTFEGGSGWEMTDSKWLRVNENRGVKALAGAYFGGKVGVNFDWQTTKSDDLMRLNDGKIAVTRTFGTDTKGVAYFYDDSLSEGRIEARDFTAKKFAGLTMEAEAVMFNPDGQNPIAFGTREPKAGYLVHIEGNNKIDGHIYVAKQMKIGDKAHVTNLHIPRLNIKDDKGTNAAGQEPADNVKEFVIGEYRQVGKVYEMLEGGTNLRMGYSSEYCWIQMWPKGPAGASLVLNAARNSVGFGTTRPLTNIPGSGSAVKMHVDGNMLVTGNLIVKGQVSSGKQESDLLMQDTETLLDVTNTRKMLNDIDVGLHTNGKMRFSETQTHPEAIGLSHVAAVLTRSLQHHQAELDENDQLLETSGATLDKLLSMAKIS